MLNQLPDQIELQNTAKLRNFLILTLILSIAVPASISGGILIYINYTKTVKHDSQINANGYVDFLTTAMIGPLWNIQPDAGAPIIESIFADRTVKAVEVFNEQGVSFLNYTQQKGSTKENTVIIERSVLREGSYLGKVQLTYSLAHAKSRATRETELLVAITFIQLIISVLVVGFALRKRVMLPIRTMQQSAHSMTLGDLNTPIKPLYKDELGVLSQQFETMRIALESSFNLLEDRVKERTLALSRVNDELKGTLNQLEKTQDTLIQSEKLAALGSLVAGVSHELNTPIGNGLTVATTLEEQCKQFDRTVQEGLTRDAFTRFTDDFKEGTAIVVRNLERASELVLSFKQVAVDQTSAQRRRFAIDSLLKEAIVTIKPAFKRTSYNIHLTCETEAKLDSFPGPLVQVITNLVNNAVAHGFDQKKDGNVNIEVKELNNRVVITVADDGNGIPESHRHKLFEPFFTTKLGAGGSGLGLHITHNIVTAILGGHIDVQSEVGVGTQFIISLPFDAPKAIKHDE